MTRFKPYLTVAQQYLDCFRRRLARDTTPCEIEPVPMLQRRAGPRDGAAAPKPLQIACPDPTYEDALRAKHINRAQFFARQEQWEEVSDLIRSADQDRASTPGAMPLAELYAYGARADVIAAAEHALLNGRPAKDAPILEGIEALEGVLEENAQDYIIAAIVALAHMDIGWAWRGTDWAKDVPEYNMAVFEAHFDRANEILKPFDATAEDSPLLAEAFCALSAGHAPQEGTIADRYQTLIHLNPANPRALRTLGSRLLPRWYGSYEMLELEARRTALRTEDTWGAGGYTWVQFDAISCDEQACANLDIDFFIEGIEDIIERSPDAHTINLLAAFCANAVGKSFSGNPEADRVRERIAACATWIVRDHLTELHPLIWAHAARGFDNNLRVYSPEKFAAAGKDDAMRIIRNLFRREIAAGKRVVFTDTGMQMVTG